MNPTVVQLTTRGLLGRRRALLLVLLPVVLLLLALLIRHLTGLDESNAVGLLGGFGLGTLVPVMSLIAGTGAIGPEIEDGSILYLLSKPVSRLSIVLSKLAVSTLVTLVLAALPTLAAGVIIIGTTDQVAVAYGLGAAIAGLAYCAIFILLSIVTRNAVVIGLLYALVWETTIAGFVPGAKALSVRQWSLAVTEWVVGEPAGRIGVESAVGLTTGVVLLIVVILGATWYAGRRLSTLRLSTED